MLDIELDEGVGREVGGEVGGGKTFEGMIGEFPALALA